MPTVFKYADDSTRCYELVIKNIRSANVFPSGFSDHELIGCVCKVNHLSFKPKEIRCRDYGPAQLNRDLLDADWTEVYGTNDVNSAWKAFDKITSTLIDIHAPMINKRVKSKPAPWLTVQIKIQMNDWDKLYRQYRKSKLDCDWRAYHDKRNQVNMMLLKARSNYNKDLLRESSNDSDKFWKSLKSIYPTSSKGNQQCKSFDINGENCTDAKQIANGFRSFFSNAVNHIKSQAMRLSNFAWRKQSSINFKTYKTFRFEEVTPVEICSLIKKLRKKKSTGCDNLPVMFLKDAKDEIKQPLTYIINLSIRNGVVPTGWKTARITPVYKSGPCLILTTTDR